MNEKNCPYCGTLMNPGDRFCTGCGKSAQESAPMATYQAPAAPQQYRAPAGVSAPVTKKEYRKICQNPKYLKNLKSNTIGLYIIAGLSAILNLLNNPWGLADVAIYLALTFAMQRGKNKACAWGILGYAIVSTLLVLLLNGKIVGWLWIIFGVGVVQAFNIADKEYDSIYGK